MLDKYCCARTKQGLCREPPMVNGRCRIHGGATPAKHPNFQGSKNAIKHGLYCKRGEIADLASDYKKLKEFIANHRPIRIGKTNTRESS